ncbi:lectin-like domain-containing protein [Psychroflexus gondwanensis]|uniref:lectin-like domain-containing protein n=1 Tax=Psychroflexus gondwanensis TaxID=251 RepID=UPI001F3E50C0|nr:T9SS type B sorting domain-containing protein [Psychroflexus gondwanensis]
MCCVSQADAQLNAQVTGDAIDQGNNCYTITKDQEFQVGGVWYNNPIDFDTDFTIFYQNNFGFRDFDGADGMALVFKDNPTPILGDPGGGLGYSGITPSLTIEFDTFQNTDFGDPVGDHISIMRNGNPDHNSGDNLGGPVLANGTNQNIEDGIAHEVRIEWDAFTNTLSVFFDCLLRLTFTADVKNTIFSGDDTVFFGFVGSTGGNTNIHEVCFNRVSFVDNLQLDDEVICENGAVQVDASIPSGFTYSWTPTNGVSDPNSPNPVLSPAATTIYTVTISDVCGETTTEELTVTVKPFITTEPVFNPVPPICQGDSLNPLPTTSMDGITGTWSPELNNSITTTYTFMPLTSECAPETTLVIEVIPSEIPIFTPVDPVCPGEFLADLPITSNNGITGTWTPGINNMVTTVYTFTPDLGQGCATLTTLEILITDPDIPTFNPIDPICVGETLEELPTTSNEGITGSWSPALNNRVTTFYSFEPNPGQCASDNVSLEIQVIPISQLSIDIDLSSEAFSENQVAVINVFGGTGAYEFQLNNGDWVEENTFSQLQGCEEYEIRVREISGCSNIAIENFRVLDYPKFFTPNGDSRNDSWNIECLKDQVGARISIYDRYGKLLASINPSRLGWDGTYNGAFMPTNDYWFRVEYLNKEGQPKVFTSNFTLKR